MQSLGRYLFAGELGRGAMGVVSEAVDSLMGRRFAITTIHREALADRSEAEFIRTCCLDVMLHKSMAVKVADFGIFHFLSGQFTKARQEVI